MSSDRIPFNLPYMTGKELYYIARAHFEGRLAGDGPYTGRCHEWIERHCEARRGLLTHSCTAALEIAAILLNISDGDEIIMPSYTFVSTANAFVLRGGVPVFVDIREDTLNIDETKIEDAISLRTKAIVPVHYAGVASEMGRIMEIAGDRRIPVVEDAAQGVMSRYRGRPLGSIGQLGAYSFHETKNLISGEGGALLVNDPDLVARAEILREKGTDRTRFFRGEVERYTWQDIGSSFLPGELIAAFLWAQLEEAAFITGERARSWSIYHTLLEPLEEDELLRRPQVPADCESNAHMYYVVLAPGIDREKAEKHLQTRNIACVSHYVPLHTSPAGRRFGRTHGALPVTESTARQLLRLPMWVGLSEDQQVRVVEELRGALEGSRQAN